MSLEYNDLTLAILILRGDFRPEGIRYTSKFGKYEIFLGEFSVITDIRGVRKYLDLLDQYLETELNKLNEEYYGGNN